MAMRLQSHGYLIGNAPNAKVYTGTPRTIKALFRQRVRWSYGFLRNGVDCTHMFGNRKYGNLDLIILPMALLSIGIAVYFYAHFWYAVGQSIWHEVLRLEIIGFRIHRVLRRLLPQYKRAVVHHHGVRSHHDRPGVRGHFHRHRATTAARRDGSLRRLLQHDDSPLWLGTAFVRALLRTGVRWR